MVDALSLAPLLTQLNTALAEVTPYKLAVVDPTRLLPIDVNAHYMTKRTYDQLVRNIQQDGNLASLPLCWRRPDGQYVVLSGNHRVEAACTAQVALILILYTDAVLSLQERRATQLAHNALVGQDNIAVLRELYAEIGDVSWKLYSGIDDTLLQTLAPVPIIRIHEAPLRLEELTLLFLPTEAQRLADVLERIGSVTRPRYAARVEDFTRFFSCLLAFKEAANIVNTATAFLAMCEMLEAWLAETKAPTEGSPDDGTR